MRDVKINLKGLERFQLLVERDLRRNGNGPIRRALKQWGVRARSFWRERFDTMSKGGGWPPLAESTKRRRRVARRGATGPRRFSILRDTGTLLNALTPTARKPGQLDQDIPFGVRVGYGGPSRHPGGRATIADIASFHQEGRGHLPRREIIVDLPDNVRDAMAGDMQRAVKRMMRDGNK